MAFSLFQSQLYLFYHLYTNDSHISNSTLILGRELNSTCTILQPACSYTCNTNPTCPTLNSFSLLPIRVAFKCPFSGSWHYPTLIAVAESGQLLTNICVPFLNVTLLVVFPDPLRLNVLCDWDLSKTMWVQVMNLNLTLKLYELLHCLTLSPYLLASIGTQNAAKLWASQWKEPGSLNYLMEQSCPVSSECNGM